MDPVENILINLPSKNHIKLHHISSISSNGLDSINIQNNDDDDEIYRTVPRQITAGIDEDIVMTPEAVDHNEDNNDSSVDDNHDQMYIKPNHEIATAGLDENELNSVHFNNNDQLYGKSD